MQSASQAIIKGFSSPSVTSKPSQLLKIVSSLSAPRFDFHESSRMRNVRGCIPNVTKVSTVKSWNYSAGPPKPRKMQTEAYRDPTKFRNVRGCGEAPKALSQTDSIFKSWIDSACNQQASCPREFNCALRYIANQ
jgi:hypothetical protein